jgi:octaprenyl-diphosphate synthase
MKKTDFLPCSPLPSMATPMGLFSCKTEQSRNFLNGVWALIGDDLTQTEQRMQEMLSSRYAFINSLTSYLERFRGKMLRPALVHLSARAFGGEAPAAVETAAVVELIHWASLCHDDVLDDAQARRGASTLNVRYGNHTAVLAGDFLLACSTERLVALHDPRPLRILTLASRRLCEGELLQISARHNETLDEETYFEIVNKKTAALFAAAAELGALTAGAGEAEAARMRVFGRHVGAAFQIADDCLDITGNETLAGKPVGADLKNGELTLPIIHLLRGSTPMKRHEIRRLLRPESAAGAVLTELLERNGSLTYAFNAAEEELRRARAELASLPASAAKTALTDLADFVLQRNV